MSGGYALRGLLALKKGSEGREYFPPRTLFERSESRRWEILTHLVEKPKGRSLKDMDHSL
ncbi:hypothetical protein A3A40_00680 [Candidatus Kaiserbacteria bacterium RIFCSPLOWO2_01_FULL_54_20]|uniref:Uncharacterized protein n=1 Tax=Candidatus Kaiserbacteria bacterium RIFCSPLOWO2_01_FULL_54_20 TaxID=1798513 RepID=A0A1F6EJF8_9BACT|nr:MAG: hypothetical protein A3A40_00680 [Candidatus Kaiserbacteria bacterium RIFCSPLOWO2_01_FULL_54_20]